MRVYIAGPMTGLPRHNYPLFNFVASALRESGYEVVNPAETTLPEGSVWIDYVRDGISKLATCEAVAMLPGWEISEGATLERSLALELYMVVAPWESFWEEVNVKAS